MTENYGSHDPDPDQHNHNHNHFSGLVDVAVAVTSSSNDKQQVSQVSQVSLLPHIEQPTGTAMHEDSSDSEDD